MTTDLHDDDEPRVRAGSEHLAPGSPLRLAVLLALGQTRAGLSLTALAARLPADLQTSPQIVRRVLSCLEETERVYRTGRTSQTLWHAAGTLHRARLRGEPTTTTELTA